MPARRRRLRAPGPAHRADRRRLARAGRGRPARAALRLPGARAVGPRARPPLQPRQAARSTPTPEHSTVRCASTPPCSARPSASDDTVPDPRLGRRSCRTRWSSTRRTTGRDDRPPDVPGPTRWSTSCTSRASRRAPRRARGTPRDVRRSRAPGRDRAPRRPRRHDRRAAAGAALLQRADAAAARAANYWGYNTIGFFAPHAGYAARGAAASRSVSSATWCGRCTPPASRCSSTSSTTTRPRAAPTARRCPSAAWTTRPTTGCSTAAATPTSPAAATPSTSATDVPAMVTDSLRYWVQEMHVDGFRFDLAAALARGNDGVRAERHLPQRARPRTRCCRR